MSASEDLVSLSLLSAPLKARCVVATCNLNQWALDFDGNLERVIESIKKAKEKGARFRLGPELEICGYSCEDHFKELDTYWHSEQSLAAILESDVTNDILCDIGMPMIHDGVRYNCRVFVLNRKILLVRPKAFLANDGNYHEPRFFRSWKGRPEQLYQHHLSEVLRQVTGQETVPIGMGVIQTKETKIAAEVCEELWVPDSPHIAFALEGVEIFANGSGSHHQLRKLDARIDLMNNATTKCGGCYMYANQQGCDGTRLYFDGSSMINVNGQMLAQASQFSLRDVEVVTACVDLDDIRRYRAGISSMQEQATLKMVADSSSSSGSMFPVIDVTHFSVTSEEAPTVSPRVPVELLSPEQECALGPACWLWDYLRRSGASGFLLPLSGGADSASVAGIVKVMCNMVAEEIAQGPVVEAERVKRDLQRIVPQFSEDEFLELRRNPTSAKSSSKIICGFILHSLYMGTENSSEVTSRRASDLATSIGSFHNTILIDPIVKAILYVFALAQKSIKAIDGSKNVEPPRFMVQGGTWQEDIALQNIQARLRMVTAYLFAQLLPWLRGNRGFLLVLGSGNVDEALRGYMTKYDCSSADLNPIGGICKQDLRKLLLWASEELDCPVLKEIVDAPPSAELQPIDGTEKSTYTQTDEDDMGMTYAELGIFGYLRKVQNCGPVSMFLKMADEKRWGLGLSLTEIARKIKHFFFCYGINRHKLTTLTPSYHAENYSPDDNRFDFRPFLYNSKWTRQFKHIDVLVAKRTIKTASDDLS